MCRLTSPNINKFDLNFMRRLAKINPNTVIHIWEIHLVVIQSGAMEPHRVLFPTICNSKDVVTGDTRLELLLFDIRRDIIVAIDGKYFSAWVIPMLELQSC